MQNLIVQVTPEGQIDLPPEIQENLKLGDEYILWQEQDTIIKV